MHLKRIALTFRLVIVVFLTIPIIRIEAAEMLSSSNKQREPFEWSHPNCQCTAELDTSKISPVNATLVINELNSLNVSGEIAWTELHKLNQQDLEIARDRYLMDYEASLKKYSSLKLPNVPVLNNYIKDLLLEQKFIKYLYISELNYLITGNSKPLDEPIDEPSLGYNHMAECGIYSQHLNSEQSIRKSLPEFIEKQCLKNVFPETCKERMEKETSDIKRAKIDLLMLGWHNCANGYYRTRIVPDHDAAYKTIQSYMKDTKCECEDAD